MEKKNNTKLLYMLSLFIVFLILGGFFVFLNLNKKEKDKTNNAYISYIPFGDSFTIGLGMDENHRWPNIMVENFEKEGINIKILENPAVSGYTVRDMIDYELPILKSLQPDFITIFIGANDSFSQTDVSIFKEDYKELLDNIQKLLPNPNKIVLITIPDYSKFPALKNYQDKNLEKNIASFNEVIKKEAIERNLVLADIFPISQKMTNEKDFIPDGLHPSKNGYIKWERVIFPKVKELLLN